MVVWCRFLWIACWLLCVANIRADESVAFVAQLQEVHDFFRCAVGAPHPQYDPKALQELVNDIISSAWDSPSVEQHKM